MPRTTAAVLAAALMLIPLLARPAPPSRTGKGGAALAEGARLFDEGRFDEAARSLESAWKSDRSERARLLLGQALAKLSRCEEALPLLRGFDLESYPRKDRKAARAGLGTAFVACGSSIEKEEEARSIVTRVRELISVKQYTAARRDAEKASKIAPGDYASLWLAYAYEVTGNCESAVRLYNGIVVENLPAKEQAEARERIEKGLEECDRPPQDMAWIPAGTFQMGSTRGDADETPVHTVALDAYYIDRTEVTVARFRRCVDSGACPKDTFLTNDDKPYCNYGKAQRDQFPVNCVDWTGAAAYCAWVGKRLPTEAEWERAARGPDGRTYPWGEAPPTCAVAVMKSESNDGCGEDRTWQIASRPRGVSEYGLFDLAGNVWEWVLDWYDPDYYRTSPEKAPQGPAAGERRVMRGGSWLSDDAGRSLRSANRDHDLPTYKGNGVGFRCAKDAPASP